MEDPRDKQNKRLLRIILISWFLLLVTLIVGATFATIQISKINQNYVELANRPPQVVKTIETQLQPIYTTIEGKRGPIGQTGATGAQGIQGLQGIQGTQGTTGKSGRNGTNGVAREIEVGHDSEGNLYQRYAGTDTWSIVPLIEVQP